MRVATVVLIFLLTGCSAPPAIRELDSASVQSIEAFVRDAESAVDHLGNKYRATSMRSLRSHVNGEIKAATAEDGSIPVSVALEALDVYEEGLSGIDAEVLGFREEWDKARTNYLDFVRARREISEFLNQEGIEPEHLDAVTRAIADYLEGKR